MGPKMGIDLPHMAGVKNEHHLSNLKYRQEQIGPGGKLVSHDVRVVIYSR